jgi:hypothetical protein
VEEIQDFVDDPLLSPETKSPKEFSMQGAEDLLRWSETNTIRRLTPHQAAPDETRKMTPI